MAYIRNNLISRRGYSGVGDTLSDIGGALKDVTGGALTFYGQSQQAQGAALATQRDMQLALAQQQGPSMTTIMLLGALGVGAVLLLRKKKPATAAGG